MKDLKFFLKQNTIPVENQEVEVSKRFKDDAGNTVKFEIKSISNEMDDALRKQNTRQVKKAKGVIVPELDQQKYFVDLVLKSLVYPDLDDKELQDSWGVMDSRELINAMLLPGEYTALLQEVQKINGWDLNVEDIKDEVKN
ncbi:phage portal protein [Leptotrichia sp. oral taxon 223]|jgi:xkdN-like protein|uniref:phage tail assembly chaperone n=1 Tax=Leptotrichia sp. oral taxon 223 TaxID=712363 RepID=UPI0015BFE461|nr:phage portal protein [Leptotrichia sp. oral taxon 223]DAJ28777.1 MAG TPA: tail assembly chaperone protein [Caudoviricetes sp.]NWO20145.1 phage portal protein [Leptotrichia sp. oral taxon 223]DAJ29945.1 MAG TPA: tail assembly chaperone protein [Caudoviricetes sp.]DAN54158.1 MAG TPA: tail assembly chaperone protein [Caudoviricetes sp.]DAT00821.1 MAG TPA: tail assembly chaperone protein [Caudoviricetes sp.]